MVWIWSDELAVCAGAAGIEDDRLEGWARRPVAYWLPPGDDVADLARRLLGLRASVDGPPIDAEPAATVETHTRICDCPAGSNPEVLAPTAVAG